MNLPKDCHWVEVTRRLSPSSFLLSLDTPNTLKAAETNLSHKTTRKDTPQPICNCIRWLISTTQWCMLGASEPWSYRKSIGSSFVQAYPGALLGQDPHLVYWISFLDMLWLSASPLLGIDSHDQGLMSWTSTVTDFPTLDLPAVFSCLKHQIFVESWCI